MEEMLRILIDFFVTREKSNILLDKSLKVF
jgi:hypothetical protein